MGNPSSSRPECATKKKRRRNAAELQVFMTFSKRCLCYVDYNNYNMSKYLSVGLTRWLRKEMPSEFKRIHFNVFVYLKVDN